MSISDSASHLQSVVASLPAARLPSLDVLNLGCGRKLITGALNLDRSPDVGADVVHDLDCLSWPLPSERFREVHANDVIEHLDDVVEAMGEIHRVCRLGAVVYIAMPPLLLRRRLHRLDVRLDRIAQRGQVCTNA